MWIISRTDAWQLSGFDVLYTTKNDAGDWQWGFIFTTLMWGLSAVIFISQGYHGFTQDQSAVFTDSHTGGGTTRLLRRLPPKFEVFLVRALRVIMFSWWDIIPDTHRPAGGAGRLFFQFFSPIVFLFIYIGFRFVVYSWQEINYVLDERNRDYTWHVEPDETTARLIRSQVVLWAAYLLVTILVRAIIPTRRWVKWTVPDKHTAAHRLRDWQRSLLPSRQVRVLWGFRGFAITFGRFLCHTYGHAAMGSFVWYSYWASFVSFFFEGCGAFFFGLVQAERGTDLKTPLNLCTKWCFWFAFNCYLQPLGTLVNMTFYVLNREYVLNVPPFEICAPILDHDGNLPLWIGSFFTTSVPLTEESENALLAEWMDTYKRKRTALGKSADKYRELALLGRLSLTEICTILNLADHW